VTDLAHVLLTGTLIRIGSVALIVLAASSLEELVPDSFQEAVAAQPIWLAFIEILIMADLGFYAVHRAFHRFPLLWRFHAIHHSIEEMDFLAGNRVHPIDQILTRGATMLPMFLMGFSSEAILLFVVVYEWHSVLLNANVKLNFGPSKWLVASPEFHHWHHANSPEAFDKNFAGQFSLLDRIFGTLHMPQGVRPRNFGIDDPVPTSYEMQILYPFRRPTTANALPVQSERS
jgi:sterol desaturase/sphingolipid hydroxylase (fatty acid hydroxylase superfamily)